MTVLAKGDKHPAKYKQIYEKASQTAAGKKTPQPYEGRTLVFELKDSKYQVTAEGKPDLPAPMLDMLAQKASAELNKPTEAETFQPKNPVKVGDSWTLYSKTLAASFGDIGDVDPANAKGQAKLTKVYQKDGKQFGVIDISIKFPVKSAGPLKFDPPATVEMKGSLDGAIDGLSTAKTMTSNIKVAGRGPMEDRPDKKKVTMETTMDISVKQEMSGEK